MRRAALWCAVAALVFFVPITALQTLPEHYRQAVGLVCLEGRPVAEAAALMGKTQRAVHGLYGSVDIFRGVREADDEGGRQYAASDQLLQKQCAKVL